MNLKWWDKEYNGMSKLLKKLYLWTEGLAGKRSAPYFLGFISFIESSFFPIPPDTLLIPMCYFESKKSLVYASITTIMSVCGALFGYLIGIFIYNSIIPPQIIVGTIISQHNFDKVVQMYKSNVFLAVFTAALTPIPYKVFTIAGGYCNVALIPFIAGSLIGRGMRFFTEGSLFYICGPAIKPYIEKNLEKLTILIAGLIILFYIIAVKLF